MSTNAPYNVQKNKKDLKSDTRYKYRTNSITMLKFYTIFKFEYEIKKLKLYHKLFVPYSNLNIKSEMKIIPKNNM